MRPEGRDLPRLGIRLPRLDRSTSKKVWLAVGQKESTPRPDGTPIDIVRFTDTLLTEAVETHIVEGVPVKIFGIVKTVSDCFRFPHRIGLSVAIEGLQEALRQRNATTGEISA